MATEVILPRVDMDMKEGRIARWYVREGETVAYSLFDIQERGALFYGPGVPVYEGMIVGEHSHPNDLDVNVTRGRKLTNIRAASRDENIILSPPREMSLEKALEWINEDELVEVTPSSIRLRKRLLPKHERERERGRAFERDTAAAAGSG